MKINLKDNPHVQLSYNSVPKLLYNELKMYIEYLLNKHWIVNSTSPYALQVVAVQKDEK